MFETFGGAISIDTWTDDFRRIQYLGVTCHYINETENGLILENRVLCVRQLDIDEKNSGEYILKEVKKTLSEFSLLHAFESKKIIFITDRGSNLIKAFSNVNERLSCFAHLLNNVCESCCKKKKPPFSILKPIRKTVRYAKISGLNNKLNSSLKSFVKTRFNSNSMMQPSLYLIWIWVIRIKSDLNINRNDCRMIRIMKVVALQYFDENFVFHWYHKVAVFLHPLYKGLQNFCTDDKDKQEIYTIVKDMMFVEENEFGSRIHADTSRSNISNDLLSFDSFMDDDSEINCNIDANTIKESEMNAYRLITVNKENFDLLNWSESHKTVFPRLYRVTVFIHAIPATSAGPERSFSLASNTITEKRNSLKPSTADALVFLNNNSDYLDHILKKM